MHRRNVIDCYVYQCYISISRFIKYLLRNASVDYYGVDMNVILKIFSVSYSIIIKFSIKHILYSIFWKLQLLIKVFGNYN